MPSPDSTAAAPAGVTADAAAADAAASVELTTSSPATTPTVRSASGGSNASVGSSLQSAASSGGGSGSGSNPAAGAGTFSVPTARSSARASGGSGRGLLSRTGDGGSDGEDDDSDAMREEEEEEAAALLLLHHHGDDDLDMGRHGIEEEEEEEEEEEDESGTGDNRGDDGARAKGDGNLAVLPVVGDGSDGQATTTASQASPTAAAVNGSTSSKAPSTTTRTNKATSTRRGQQRLQRRERARRGAAAAFSLRSMLLLRRRQWRQMLRVHVRRGLEGAPGDRLREPFSWYYVIWALLAGLVLVACVGFASSVTLSGGVVLLWFVPPVATLIFCTQPRAAWPYTAAALATVEVVAVMSGHGRISQDSLAALLLIVPDLLMTVLGTLVLRPLIGGSIGIVRSSTFIRYLGLYVLIITPTFSLIAVGLIVLLPSNSITWLGGRQLVVAWVLGDFFANYFTVYAALVFRHAIANATKESYRFSDLVTFCRVRLKEGGALLKIHFVEFAGMLAVVYLVAHSVAISSTSTEPLSRLVSRLMFPVLGVVTFRFGQFGSCVALIVASAAIFMVTYGQLDRTDKLTDIFYQIDLLLGPVLVILITWTFTYLAVALAEKQDALTLLQKRNVQLLVQGRELNAAKLEAQRALSTKTEFFARVSHEFRTPLNIILGFAEEIRRRPLPPYVQERIGYIITSGESLLRIVDDILELFRLSSQRLQIDVSAVNIHTYFTTLCDLVQVITDKSQRQLVRELDPSLPKEVLLDKIRFSQLIMNLTSNAAKFTGIGGVIHIRLKRGDAPPPATDPPPDPNASSASSSSASSNPSSTTPPIPPEAAPLPPPLPTHNLVWLRLEVEDDGIGIPRELQTQIFSCFFSGAHQPGAEKGHGLGLAITKELVDLMRGRISVQSEVGRGSVFTVLLPVTVVDAAGGIKEGGDATALSARASPSPPLPNGETPAPEQQPQQHTQTTQRTSPLAAFTTLADRLSGGGGNGGWGSKGAAAAGRWTSRGAAAGGTSAPSSSSSSSTALPPSATPTLPRPPPTATAPAAALAGGTGGEGEGRRLRGVRVLAVEDMLPNQMVLGGMLREDEHGVQFVETARGALELLSAHPEAFDAVLLDIELPDAHGITLLDRVRGHFNPRVAQIPIVVVTAVAMDWERARCYEHGADDFVTKPIRLATLRDCLLRLYRRGRIRPRSGLTCVQPDA